MNKPALSDEVRFYKYRDWDEYGQFLMKRITCSKLSPSGRCTMYERNPMVCGEFREGGAMCLLCRKLEGLDVED